MKLATVTLASLWLSCAPSTQITFDLRTDVPCSEIDSIGLSVGPVGTVEDRAPVMTTSKCEPGESLNAIGTYAVVPQSGPVELSVRVVLAEKGYSAESDCSAAKGYKGCIVARRRVSFIPRRGLVVPVDLYLVCKDVVCDADSTCNRLGRCVAAQVDVTQCQGDTCGQTVTTPGSNSETAPALAAYSSWVASPATLAADGVTTTTLTLTLRDGFDHPVVGQTVSLNASGRDNRWMTLRNATDDAGVFVATLASSVAERKTVRASTVDLALDTVVTFDATGLSDGGIGDAGLADGGLDDGGIVDGGIVDGGIVDGGPGVVASHIATGRYHSCFVNAARGVLCWGDNYFGQLGTGDLLARVVPTAVVGLSYVLSVTAGERQSCASMVDRFILVADGGIETTTGLHCWGQRHTSSQALVVQSPWSVPGTAGALTASDGEVHTCYVTALGGAECWGGNQQGQLGQLRFDDGIMQPNGRSAVASGVTAVAAGGLHACALSAGRVHCWGDSTVGQVGFLPHDGGVGGTTTAVNGPVTQIASGVVAIASGHQHNCAVFLGGQIKCWGDNTFGQLGDGTTTMRGVPMDVPGLTGVVAVTAGYNHTCALTITGAAKCWGDNSSGQCGDGTTGSPRLTPTDVIGLDGGLAEISAGGAHTCAVTANGAVRCWGDNAFGQLGSGTRTPSSVPIEVLTP